MSHAVFIGDEVTAAGFRLAGIPAFAPEPEVLTSVVLEHRETCELLLITAEAEAALPSRLRVALAESATPLVAVVPDARGAAQPPDMEGPVRRALGLEVDG